MDPDRYPRRVLLCVTGLTPQIITETLYDLAVQQRPAFVPTEVHLVTTAEGALRARLTLLDPDQGQFYRLCEDYGLDPKAIGFSPETIHIIRGSDEAELDDIRTPEDNEAAADAITDLVRRLTRDPDCAVHASIAGGRKTMGFYLGYALSLFGRPQDRLSHVLVTSDLESHPEFFFPPRKPRVLFTRENRPVSTDQATVTLAAIPFVRLRPELPDYLLDGNASFSATVQQAQRSLGPAELVLDPKRRQVRCNDTEIALAPIDFAFLAWFARRLLEGKPGIRRSSIQRDETAEFLREYRALNDELSGEAERVEAALAKGMDEDYFDARRSHVHARLKKALGRAGSAPFLIRASGRRPYSRYGLGLQVGRVRFAILEGV